MTRSDGPQSARIETRSGIGSGQIRYSAADLHFVRRTPLDSRTECIGHFGRP
jgi:hypothetical protein